MAEHHLTVDDLEQAGRILIPLVSTALRPEFQKLREDLTGSVNSFAAANIIEHQKSEARMKAVQGEVEERLARHDARIRKLENMRLRVMLIWGVGVSVVSMLGVSAGEAFFRKLFGGH